MIRPFGLTTRQLEIAIMLCDRMTNMEIARALGLSPHTVKRHVEVILLKTGASRRTDLRQHTDRFKECSKFRNLA